MGSGMADLGEAGGCRGADLLARAVGAAQLGKARLDRLVALDQRVIVRVGHLRRVLLVIELVVMGDLGLRDRQARPSPRPWSACRPASPLPPSAVSSCSASCGDQPIGRRARLVADGGAGEHAGDLLAPGRPVEGDDAGQTAGLAAALLHPPVMLVACAATWGEWVTTRSWRLWPRAVPAARRRRPPWRRRCRCRPRRTPGWGRCLEPASTTLRASRNRASSPPEAMRPMGPGGAAGVGRDLEGDAIERPWPPLRLRQPLEPRWRSSPSRA